MPGKNRASPGEAMLFLHDVSERCASGAVWRFLVESRKLVSEALGCLSDPFTDDSHRISERFGDIAKHLHDSVVPSSWCCGESKIAADDKLPPAAYK